MEYLSDKWNYLDMLLTWGSVLNIIFQLTKGPRFLLSEILMILISMALIVKVFFFLRMFPTLTPIVVMLMNVVYDLRIFLLFYVILIFFFAQMYSVLGLGIIA